MSHRKGCDCFFCQFPGHRESVEDWTDEFTLARTYTHEIDRIWNAFERSQPKNAHWMSSVFGTCSRLQYLRWHGETPTNPGGNEEIMELGNDIEAAIVRTWEAQSTAMGGFRRLPVQRRATIVEPLLKCPILGKIDLFIVRKDEWVPVEIKSTKDFGGDNRYAHGTFLPGDPEAWKRFKPATNNVGQLTLYMRAYLGKTILGLPVSSYGLLHYRNRNTAADYVLKIPYIDDIYELAVDYFAGLEKIYGQSAPPEVPKGFDRKRYPCSWKSGETIVKCDFWDHCWKATGTSPGREAASNGA